MRVMEQAKRETLDAWHAAIKHISTLGHENGEPTFIAWAFARALEFIQAREAEGDSESIAYIHALASRA